MKLRWHRFLYERWPWGWRARWRRNYEASQGQPMSVADMDRILKVVWGNDRAKAELEHTLYSPALILTGQPDPLAVGEAINFDWWEPTSKWRRMDARMREAD